MSRVTDRNKPDDEDAAQLKLGPRGHSGWITDASEMRCTDFSDPDTVVNMLTLAEVKLLLSQIEDSGRAPDNPVFTKTKDYVSTFSRFEGAEMAAAARTTVPQGDGEFEYFEQVQLINLCPMEAEEAKALIPSIKMDDDKLQEHLNTLTLQRKSQIA
ncbi:hypothetical protein BMF94_4808 [Rhodotorula taiwanensis]|uniref:RNA polymerase Rpb4/RPC9 core domain-containing protein n=1 Tax=Rhodotorula taiwanensis TaxID=741276 RepID=A0A2S5B636_9BASI|nr:hypothetical protein BMF94_4808 [Rhodotorula taiwanensis]